MIYNQQTRIQLLKRSQDFKNQSFISKVETSL